MCDHEEPELLVELDDTALGLHGWIVVDSTVLGPAFGGIRRAGYRSAAAALDDARRLARAMRDKCALAGLHAGGAKTVLLDDGATRDWPAIYAALGREVDALGGRYVCGPDVGTGAAQLEWVRSATAHCNPAHNDASVATAAGVLAAMRAVWPTLGSPGPRGLTVVVQGLGGVGGRLARALVEDGARVIAADPDRDAATRAREQGIEIVAPDRLATIACDVLAPCALGDAIDAVAAASWPCRAICGAANNALAPGAEAVLHRRGIIVVPDVIASAGAVIEGVLTVRAGHGADAVVAAIGAIEHTTRAVLDEAAARGLPTHVVARQRARARLDSARAGSA